MDKVFAVFLCAALLLGTDIQGTPISGRGRCICPVMSSNIVPKKPLGKVEVYAANTSCDRVEIIATLKATGEQRCLNPNSKTVQDMLRRMARNRAMGNAGRRGKGAAGRSSPQ